MGKKVGLKEGGRREEGGSKGGKGKRLGFEGGARGVRGMGGQE